MQRSPNAAPSAANAIGRSTTIVGSVSGTGGLTILGAIEGAVEVDGTVTLEADASLTGDIKTDQFIIRGAYAGAALVGDIARLEAPGSVSGELTADNFDMQAGATLSATLTITPSNRSAS